MRTVRTLVCIVLIAALLAGALPAGAIGSSFFNNHTDWHFDLTRGQIVTFLWRAFGKPAPRTGSAFTDVPADAYFAEAVAWAVGQGITNGTTATSFAPDATCARAQVVTFLYRSK